QRTARVRRASWSPGLRCPAGAAWVSFGGVGRSGAKAVEDLAGVGHDEGAGVVAEGIHVEGGRIEIAEVRLANDLLGDTGRERHPYPLLLTVDGVVATCAVQMCRVRELAARDLAVFIPVRGE